MHRIFLILLLAIPAAHADSVYKWKDKDGNVMYTSEPPPANIKKETIEGPPAPTEAEVAESRDRTRKQAEYVKEMQEKRREQEAQEAEIERLRLEKQKKENPTVVIDNPVYINNPPLYPSNRPYPGRSQPPVNKPMPNPVPSYPLEKR
ncbi:MAG: DUF4124 domain-containing protein [Sulfuricellaceae bacterium]|nr:DUF4124 domain-containing protein [Sulfuricellaceae bacterium]